MSKNYNRITSDRRKQLESIRYLYNDGKISKAMTEIVEYIEQYPSDMHGRYLYGKILLKCNRYEEAKEEFNSVYYSNSKNKYSGLVAIGEIEEMQGNIDKARHHYRKAIKESPFLERIAIRNLTHIERKEKNYEEAIKVISLLGDDNVSGLIEKARNLTLLNRYEESEEILNNINPTTIEETQELLLEKSCIAKEKGDYDTALEYLQSARVLSEKDPMYYLSVYEEAKINIKRGFYDEALENCQELISHSYFFDYEVYLMSGICKKNKKKLSESSKDFKMAAMSKNSDTASTAIAYLGTNEYLKGNEAEAEELYRKAIERSPYLYPTRYGKLLNILLRQQRYIEADEVLKEAISKDNSLKNENEFYIASLIIDKNLNRTITPGKKVSYVGRQIMNYQESSAIDHIVKKHSTNIGDKSVINPELDIKELFAKLKVYLTPDYLVSKSVSDTYVVDFPNVGREGQNQLSIATIPGTTDIITMYPIEDNLFIRRIDIKQGEEENISKNNDRTSKFYKKYGMQPSKK